MHTEDRNPNSAGLDEMSTAEMLRVMNAEDKTVALAIEQALPQISAAVDAIVERLRRGGRLLYVGAGTSGRLGVLDAVECVPTFGTAPERVQGVIAGGTAAFMQAIEGAEDNHAQGAADVKALSLTADDVVVGIAASGRTPYVLGAIEHAQAIGAATIGFACNDPAPLLDAAALPIAVPVGAEVIAGSTRLKAGSAQKMVLNMLSTASMVQLGKVYGNLMVDVRVTNAKLAARARRILMAITGVDAERADVLLTAADNHVKVAAVMELCDADAATARELLARAEGHLRQVLQQQTESNSS